MTPASDEAPIPAMCTGCMKWHMQLHVQMHAHRLYERAMRTGQDASAPLSTSSRPFFFEVRTHLLKATHLKRLVRRANHVCSGFCPGCPPNTVRFTRTAALYLSHNDWRHFQKFKGGKGFEIVSSGKNSESIREYVFCLHASFSLKFSQNTPKF